MTGHANGVRHGRAVAGITGGWEYNMVSELYTEMSDVHTVIRRGVARHGRRMIAGLVGRLGLLLVFILVLFPESPGNDRLVGRLLILILLQFVLHFLFLLLKEIKCSVNIISDRKYV